MSFINYPLEINLEIIVKIVLAVILGIMLGLERERRGKKAGIRTYALITLGSTVFTIVSLYGFPLFGSTARDTARIAAQIVTGIGFIGAGVIWKNEDHVEGITTAAGLWIAAAIGLMVGVGMFIGAIFSTLISLIIFLIGKKMKNESGKKTRNIK